MEASQPPEAIALFSSDSLRRAITVWGAYRSDGMWQNGLKKQVGKFFTQDERKSTYLPVFAHQAMKIRPAFFGLNAVLRQEQASRAARHADLAQFERPVVIIFGADDPYLNPGVAREFHELFQQSSLYLVPEAGHYVQLDQPEHVAQLILSEL